MIYILDTDALSALMRGSAAVVERLAGTAPSDVAIPPPVLAEITFGIERLPRKRRAALQARFDFTSANSHAPSGPMPSAGGSAASRQLWNAVEPD